MKALLITTCEAGENLSSRTVLELQNLGIFFCFVLVMDVKTVDVTTFVWKRKKKKMENKA